MDFDFKENKNQVELKEYTEHDKLVDFYISRGIEFNDDKQYPHPPEFSYIATMGDSFVGAITVCKEGNDFILDEVAVVEEKEGQGIGTLLIKKAIEHIENIYI